MKTEPGGKSAYSVHQAVAPLRSNMKITLIKVSLKDHTNQLHGRMPSVRHSGFVLDRFLA